MRVFATSVSVLQSVFSFQVFEAYTDPNEIISHSQWEKPLTDEEKVNIPVHVLFHKSLNIICFYTAD